MDPLFDRPGAVRAEDRLDLARLLDYLRPRLPGFEGEVELRQFPSGASNLTYLLRAGARELVLRMPPAGTKAQTAHDMSREFRVLERLRPLFPYCPAPILACDDPSVLGAPFYAMERLRGLILRRDLPAGLELSPAEARRLCENLVATQVRLHGVDWAAGGLADLGKPPGYVERQVRGWSERFRRARTTDVPDGERVMAWLEAHRPPDTLRPAIVHNDYRLDNVVLDPADRTTLVGVLDWEMATLGDPLMDLGCGLAYWVEAADPPDLQRLRLQPSHLPGMLTRREMVEVYAARSGRAVGDFSFYEIFGLFRLAVIAQQIYYRFAHGETSNPRAGALGAFVPTLLSEAQSRLDRLA
jgi:aminoglycoside phosphotransferase (APT) family kinase protein